ncbi:MAG: hypothetical protein GY866_04825 [Proteobacteria bacterium]|nr:hypothetical protein [Pseudomonadota bacterium]
MEIEEKVVRTVKRDLNKQCGNRLASCADLILRFCYTLDPALLYEAATLANTAQEIQGYIMNLDAATIKKLVGNIEQPEKSIGKKCE